MIEGLETRPVTIIGGGFQGRRIALMWASRGRPVVVFDTVEAAREATVAYFDAEAYAFVDLASSFSALPPHELIRLLPCEKAVNGIPGKLTVSDDLATSVKDAWLVIEAVPEVLELKRSVFRRLEELAPSDCILATNSSSYKSRKVAQDLGTQHRVCNIHYFRPPEVVACEVMTSGFTDPSLLSLLIDQLKLHKHTPFLVRAESTGFIHNRIWAAIKREALCVVAEGVAEPSDVDGLFKARFKTPQGPFEIMDGVGLDVVLDIENHYAKEQPHLPVLPREILRRYLDAGRKGTKSGAGFYDWSNGSPEVLPVLH